MRSQRVASRSKLSGKKDFKVHGGTITWNNVIVAPGYGANLIGDGVFVDRGCKVITDKHEAVVILPNGKTLITFKRYPESLACGILETETKK